MAINKNFVVKNGIEVNTNLIVADTDSNKVGIGTTVPEYTLHVFEGAGIGVTDITITGISTNLDELNVGVGGTTLTAISNATLGIGGSVGVGTDDPGYLLEVHSPVTSGQTALYVRGDMVVTGDINIDDISIGDLNVSGISTFVGNIIIGTGATVGFGSTAYFKDYAKAIFGDGEDLKIYHDGANSYISDTGTGGLILQASPSIELRKAGSTEKMLYAEPDAQVELYYNNSKKFETNAIGVEVSGTFESTGITTLASDAGITTTGGDLYVGGDLYINEDVILDTNLTILGIATIGVLQVSSTSGINTISSTVQSSSKDTGALVIEGGVGIEKNLFVGGGAEVTGIVTASAGLECSGAQMNVTANFVANSAKISDLTNNRVVIAGSSGELEDSADLTFDGSSLVVNAILESNDATQSSSSATGSAQFAGGVGIAKNLYVGGGAEVTGLTTITGVLDANNTTQSSSSTTGAAKFAGGVGIEKQLYVGAGASVGAGLTVAGDILPEADGTRDLGSSGAEFKDLYIDGTANIDSLTLTSGSTVTVIRDEDDMSSDSDTSLATQQSIKAYVDAQVTAADLDFQGDSGGAQSVDLDSQTFTIAGTSNEIETSGSGQTLTIGLPNDVTIGNDLTVTNDVSIASSVFHTGDLNSSFGFPAADTFTVYTSGKERFKVNSLGRQQSHAEYDTVGINTFASWARHGGAIRAEVGYNAVTTDYMYFGTGTNHPLALRVNNTDSVYLKNDGKIGVGTNTALNSGVMTLYAADEGEGTAKGQLELKDTAAFGSTPTGGIIFSGHHTAGSQAIFAGIRGFKANTSDGDLDGCLAFDVRKHGAVAYEAMRINEDGEVGIGTDKPELQYFNDLVIGNNVSGDKGITIRTNSDSSGILAFSDTDVGDANRYDGYIRYSHVDQHMGFYTNGGNERARITSAGNVGINSTIPTKKLDVQGNAVFGASATRLTTYSDSTYSGIFNGSSLTSDESFYMGGGNLFFYADGSERLRVTSSGSVGINTNNPNGKLQINDGLHGLEFNPNNESAIVSYNRTTSAYGPVGFQGSAVKLKIGGTGTIVAVEAGGTITTGIATFSSTSHLTIPVGTTAQRDSIVANGMIRYNTTLNSYEGYGNGAWGGLGGGTEIDTSVSTTTATNLIGNNFLAASYRSASMRIQITQGSSYQVGKYLLIHDGTTVTIVEESAIATGDMLGSISGAINGDYVQVKVSMNSASSATVTTIVDKITV